MRAQPEHDRADEHSRPLRNTDEMLGARDRDDAKRQKHSYE